MVLSDIIIFLMVAGLLGGLIYVMASPNRYAKMTDEEFEEDTKRGSVLVLSSLAWSEPCAVAKRIW
jgi:hypothetical protein